MLVGLPIGSAVLTFLSDLQATRSGLSADASRSRWLLGLTVLTGLAAAPSGLLDALTIKPARASAVTWLHAGGNAAMLAIGLVEWSRRRRAPLIASQVWPSVSAIMVGILTVTGWLGGELAYRKGIGMDPQGVEYEPDPDEVEPGSGTERPAGTAGLTGAAGLPGGDEPAEGRRDISRG
jgi:uncharacterized membrane protein